MTGRRARRYGTLLSVVLALLLAMALAACTDDEGDLGGEGTPGSLLERAAEGEAGDAEPTREGIFGTGSQSTAELEEAADEPQPTATRRPLLTFGPTSAETDREALVALFNATGPIWFRSIGWLSDAPLSEWYGVTTDDDGRVTELRLPTNELGGEIPPELGNLANLESLNLGDNRLGGEIPPELGNLANLEYLNLRDNWLSGEIPPELGNLANLRELRLLGNELSGCVPSNLEGQLGVSQLGGLPYC